MIRLQRVGRKNDPSYRIIVTDKRASTKSNKNVDLLGSYNPKLGTIQIDGEKAKHWLAHGAQASVTVHNILVSQKVIEGKKLNALSRKSPIVDEEAIKKAAEEKAAKEAAEAQKAADEAAAAEAASAQPTEEAPVTTPEEKKEEVAA